LALRLEQAIQDDVLPAGSRLENEIAFGMRLGLSRATVGRAVQQLVDKGLLVRRRGVGTVVLRGKGAAKAAVAGSFTASPHASENWRTLLLQAGPGQADELAAEALAVPLGSPVLHLRRLGLADNIPMAILCDTLPPEFLDLDVSSLAIHSLSEVLRARGASVKVAKHRLSSRVATAEESELLRVSEHQALMTTLQTGFGDTGRAVRFGRHCYHPALYLLETTVVTR
jgi:DNA-binding GntR family transcriptional regulator